MLGKEVTMKGLALYFSKHAWSNTELKDYIGAYHDAYLQYGGGALGPDFNLWEWSDTWLSSSGVNILEPVIEWAANGSVTKLQIKQSNDLRGKNRLRKQKIDVAVYDEEFKPHFVKDILISEKDALNDVPLHFDKPVTAVIINVNDHGYAKVRYDAKTLDAFVHNLQKIEDPVTRAQVWRQLWLLVMDRKMSSLQYFDFVVKQIPYETVDQIIQAALMNLSSLVSFYIPTHMVVEKRKIMFDVLLGLLANEAIDAQTKIPIVDNLFGFLSDKDHLNIAMDWMQGGHIFTLKGGERQQVFKLGQKHKYSILKKMFEEPSMPTEVKTSIMDTIIGEDKSDIAENTRETCLALIPSAESKAQIWAQIIDPNSTESLYKR
jgi:aminopeptidase N